MGLLRKTLWLSTAGVIAPNSKRQKRDARLLAATQGATPREVRRAGGRLDPFSMTPPSLAPAPAARIGSPRTLAVNAAYTDAELAAAVEKIHGPPLLCGHLACYRLPDGACAICLRGAPELP
jgi:hypothetical protein